MTEDAAPPLRRAAEYVRMSTEHQKYSITYQQAANRTFAAQAGFEIVRSYADAGVSGLKLEQRAALKQLLADVLGGRADFDTVLVYDVSRWGRFQDPDESAHYEFVCRAAGVGVTYCAEPFANDGSLTSTLVKHLKRAMAAEYSRELSAKVQRAHRGLTAQGYWCGGQPSYGFRRCILEPDGTPGRVLERGERKALQGRRMVLVRGPDDEVAIVRRIFREYVVEGRSTAAITEALNNEGVPGAYDKPWTRGKIRRLLLDEKYAGVLVTGRSRTTLRVSVAQPRHSWTRVPGACPRLVSPEMYRTALQNLQHTPRDKTDAELIEDLKACFERHGAVSGALLRMTPGMASAGHYRKRFGGLMAAYALAGFTPTPRQRGGAIRRIGWWQTRFQKCRLPDDELLRRLRALYARRGRMTSSLIDEAPDLPGANYVMGRFGPMLAICALVGATPSARQAAGTRNAERRREARAPQASGLFDRV